jgi:hypothetical protein
MIIEPAADSPALVRGALAAVLYLHIGGGLIGIATGAAALVVRKGGPLHKAIGNLFYVSMLVMASIGALASPFLPTPDWVNVVAGLFTFYLVATARRTVNLPPAIGAFDLGALVFASIIAIAGIAVGLLGILRPGSVGDGPSGAALVFGGIAVLAAFGDWQLIRHGVAGKSRVGRHLWRMCLALFIAVGSLFGGQPQVFPEAIRGTPLLMLPTFATLCALIYWMIRVRFSSRWRS